MKINAYVLAASPAWIEASVRSYYDLCDRIVVSYDDRGLGWTGKPVDATQSLRRLRAIDPQNKMRFLPGNHSDPAHFQRPMTNQLRQRQAALDAAGDGADWVLQIDTDEVVPDAEVFRGCLERADAAGAAALNFPALWLYSRIRGRWYLAECDRLFRRFKAGYPGPVAVRAGSRLTLCRRTGDRPYHVDVRAGGSRSRVPHDVDVAELVTLGQALCHLSAVRDERWLKRKYECSGHAFDRDWDPIVAQWVWAQRHPFLQSVKSQFERGNYKRHLRPLRVARTVAGLLADSRVSEPEPAAAGPPLVPGHAAATA
ncbi:MAG: hypothetical protein AAF800_05630 [Planctomycetota bacterium]